MQRSVIAVTALLASAARLAMADIHTAGVPALNSRPGAPYTIYLDFGGFDYTGTWYGVTPGMTPAFDGAVGVFTAQQQADITQVWARVAEKYAAFNINITTVDPAVGAGQAGTDAQRQAYYEATAKMMHTVVGGSGGWTSGSGQSWIRTTQMSYSTVSNGGVGEGYHTNWVFAAQAGGNPAIVGEIASHENGHGLGLYHQADWQNGAATGEYASNFGASGNGSYAPVMGSSYRSERGTWRVGERSTGTVQNDVKTILGNSGIGGLADDGVGHAATVATALPINAGAVDATAAKGVIVPALGTNPVAIGAENYSKDYFSFRTDGTGTVSLVAYDGGSRITPGVVDPGGTLRSTLKIYDGSMNLVGTAVEDASTMFETFAGTLPAGRYVAEVASYGGYASTVDTTATYFDMGSFLLNGSGFSAAKWVAPAGGEWAVAGNWLGGALPGAGEDAVVPASAGAVTHSSGVDRVRSVTAGAVAVTGGSLTVDGAVPSAVGSLAVSAGATVGKAGGAVMTVNGALALDGTLSVQGGKVIAAGPVAGSNTAGRPGGVVSVTGGELVAKSLKVGSLVATGGRVSVQPAALGGGTSVIDTLALSGTGTLDMADDRLVVTNGGVAAVRGSLQSAFDNGAWDGPGLTSSIAQGDSLKRWTIGYATAGQLGITAWGGVSGLLGGEVITRLTAYGDANLDGVIDNDDFALADKGVRQHLTGWAFGDFDYSGTVDATDVWLMQRGYLLEHGISASGGLLAGWDAQYGEGYVAALVASVPEPGMLGTAVLAGVAGLARRRRK